MLQQVIAITGASAGVGRAAAVAFGRRGAAVALIARSLSGLESAAEEVRAAGGRALPLVADVSDPSALAAAASEAERALGPIDVWVNAAMVTIFGEVEQMTPEEVRRVTEVTYLGTVNGTMAALHRMQERGHGTIVQVGSALAYRSIPLQSAYCGAKAAVRGFTDSLRCELIHQGSAVRLTMVQLPAVNTPQFEWARAYLPHHPQPVPPIFEPEVAADAILWAAEHPAREYVVGASSAMAILGQKVAPGLLDRYLASTAYAGQQTAEPISLDRADNLFHPVEGLHATRGRFTRESRGHSLQFEAVKHAGTIGLAALALLAGATLAATATMRKDPPRTGAAA
ncbi:NAD(P)-dependent dehydrogenase (short-subunit alcohol dehydrogenase family) [Constrictibacter sp. MBR-5]|uniref:SDR family oxidoreductase n=1 Tax=Constrictibacter sp. MBR-5 TaxID=3156467 RepID=UPI0033990CEC